MHSEGCYSAYGRCDESLIETLDRYAHSEGCYSSFGRCDEPLIETLDRYVHIKGYYCAFGRCGESLIETLNEYREPPDRTPRAATPPSAAAMSPCSNFGPLRTFRGLLLGLRPLRRVAGRDPGRYPGVPRSRPWAATCTPRAATPPSTAATSPSFETLDHYVHSEGCYSASGHCVESLIKTLDRYVRSEDPGLLRVLRGLPLRLWPLRRVSRSRP